MLVRSLIALALVTVLVALGIATVASAGAAPAAASGAALGFVSALTAVLGAGWAQARGLEAKGSLAYVLGGMLFRMALVAVWAAIAFRWYSLAPVPFLAGFALLYLPGQVIEIRLLWRKRPSTLEEERPDASRDPL